MFETKIKSIVLKNFRNHKAIGLNIDENTNIICIIDKNGSGKTSILEAISLLSPGHGMRGATLKEMMNTSSADNTFFAGINLDVSDDISYKIDITYQGGKKKIMINDKNIKEQGELKKLANVIWLTPELQIGISTDKAVRRKFIDRMAFNFYHNHAELLINYDNLTKERLKVLQSTERLSDNSWLDSIEKQLGSIAYEIAKNRSHFVSEFTNNISKVADNLEFTIQCSVQEFLNDENAQINIAKQYCNNRHKDKITSKTNFGTHRYNPLIRYKNTELSMCSSGEKKYAIMTFLTAAAHSIVSYTNHTPIVLIDEFFSFIDENFQEILLKNLMNLKCQIWLTGTQVIDIKYDNMVISIDSLSI